MKDNTMELLSEAIASEFDNLSSLDPGSEEHSKAVESLSKLYKLKIEETKNESDLIEKQKEEQFKQEQMREQKIDRWVKVGVAVGELAIPLMFYGAWMRRGFKFEETGSYCSQTFRNFFSRLKPTKK
jgi:hypothetical protein